MTSCVPYRKNPESKQRSSQNNPFISSFIARSPVSGASHAHNVPLQSNKHDIITISDPRAYLIYNGGRQSQFDEPQSDEVITRPS